ncbi:MAG: class II aldolase/adducin family protein [Verrucomicrobiota bacterium]|nr:class II aldolase/adducin family protein [Verrucomicrobiota bacterium]
MSKVYTAKDVEAILAKGGSVADIPAGTILTPSARDLLKEQAQGSGQPKAKSAQAVTAGNEPYAPILPDYTYRWEGKPDPKTPAEIQKFFNSPEIQLIKERMVDMGRRMWEREYTDGNGGNLVVRVGENLFLCTQTLISKGFMTPETIGLVDWEGKQLAGKYKRTSEVLTHLAVYKNQPKARATCHAHPVHATAFAVAKMQPPTCMIPEAEVFLGQIGLAEYQTPGTPANAKAVGDVAKDHHAILMLNHGVITWGDHIEDAYWKMENTESYCKCIWVAMHLTPDLGTITGKQAKELIQLRKSLGMNDKREGWKECELCDNSEWPRGVTCTTQAVDAGTATQSSPFNPEAEALVKKVTDLILEKLGASR